MDSGACAASVISQHDSLAKFIISVFGSDFLSDCFIQCADGAIRAHRVVLAAWSPFLRRILVHDDDLVFLPDFTAQAVEDLLRFLHGTVMDQPVSLDMELLKALQVDFGVEYRYDTSGPVLVPATPATVNDIVVEQVKDLFNDIRENIDPNETDRKLRLVLSRFQRPDEVAKCRRCEREYSDTPALLQHVYDDHVTGVTRKRKLDVPPKKIKTEDFDFVPSATIEEDPSKRIRTTRSAARKAVSTFSAMDEEERESGSKYLDGYLVTRSGVRRAKSLRKAKVEAMSLKCQKCDVEFKDEDALTEHLHAHVPSANMAELEDGKSVCLYCREVIEKAGYGAHLRARHNKQLAFCKACNLFFASTVELKKHQETDETHKMNADSLEKSIKGELVWNPDEQKWKTFAVPLERWCELCEVEIEAKVTKKQHMRKVHPDNKIIKRKPASLHDDLLEPFRVKIPRPSSWCCRVCREKFVVETCYYAHMLTHARKEKQAERRDPHKGYGYCPECDMVIEIRRIYAHQIAHHNPVGRYAYYHCDKCKKNFQKRDAILQHLKYPPHVAPGQEPPKNTNEFLCSDCGSAFNSKTSLTSHVYNQHKTAACKECGITFKNYQLFMKHKIAKHVTKELICETCGESFKERSKLTIHHYIKHTEDLRYKCRYCDEAFKITKSRDRHEVKYHNTRGKDFACSICSAAFYDKSGLNRHHYQVHSDELKYPCSFCGQRFKRSESQKAHMSQCELGRSNMADLLGEVRTGDPLFVGP